MTNEELFKILGHYVDTELDLVAAMNDETQSLDRVIDLEEMRNAAHDLLIAAYKEMNA